MNAARRKSITGTLITLRAAVEKFRGEVDDAKQAIESMRDDEQGSFDNMPEGLQESERGEKAQEAINALEEFISTIEGEEDTADIIITAIEDLEGAGL